MATAHPAQNPKAKEAIASLLSTLTAEPYPPRADKASF